MTNSGFFEPPLLESGAACIIIDYTFCRFSSISSPKYLDSLLFHPLMSIIVPASFIHPLLFPELLYSPRIPLSNVLRQNVPSILRLHHLRDPLQAPAHVPQHKCIMLCQRLLRCSRRDMREQLLLRKDSGISNRRGISTLRDLIDEFTQRREELRERPDGEYRRRRREGVDPAFRYYSMT